MGKPFKKFDPCCTYEPPTKWSDGFSPFEIVNKVIDYINDFIEYCNGLQGQIDAKEDSDNITNNRKLSENGDFTGTLNGEPVTSVISRIGSNEDQIQFLTDQFEDGATGLVIDGGAFNDTEIDKQYDGGAW